MEETDEIDSQGNRSGRKKEKKVEQEAKRNDVVVKPEEMIGIMGRRESNE